MKSWQSLTLSKKLPLLFVGFSLSVALIVFFIGFNGVRTVVLEETRTLFKAAMQDRRDAAQAWVASIERDIRVLSSNPSTADALESFQKGWSSVARKEDATAYLQDQYITKNPNPAGQKDLMESPEAFGVYHLVHKEFHASMREFQQGGGYLDLYLMSPEGDLVYSVFKQPDYATNVVDGDFAGSGLGRVFDQALNAEPGTIYFEDFAPYAPLGDAPASFVAMPIYDQWDTFKGVLALQMPVDGLTAIANSERSLGETGLIMIAGTDGRSRHASRLDNSFSLFDTLPNAKKLMTAPTEPEAEMIGTGAYSGQEAIVYSSALNVFGVTWHFVAEKSVSELLSRAIDMRNDMMSAVAIGACIVALLGLLVARSLNQPISRVAQGLARLSEGDYDIDVKDAARGDEIGHIAKNLLITRDKLAFAHAAERERADLMTAQKNAIEALRQGLSKLSEGDFTHHIGGDVHKDFQGLFGDFNQTIDAMTDTLSNVIFTAEGIHNGAAEISTSSDDLARRTEHQAVTLEQTSTALRNLTQTVIDAAEHAHSALDFVAEAQTHTESSGSVVTQAVDAMARIRESSNQITSIVGVIEDITFQTNLLALNAGVEAARAGDAGKGFAVVASEVRALAKRSSEAAKEIKTLIDNSTSEVRHGAELVTGTGEALTSISERVGHITTLVTEIADGAKMQSATINEINDGVSQLGEVTQSNAAMAEEATSASHMLKAESRTLIDFVNRFKIAKDPDKERVQAGA